MWKQIKIAVVCFHVMNGLLFIDPLCILNKTTHGPDQKHGDHQHY